MLNDYGQHNDCPEEVFGDRTAADACDDAIALIKEMLEALNIAKCYMEADADDEQERRDYALILEAIAVAKATPNQNTAA